MKSPISIEKQEKKVRLTYILILVCIAVFLGEAVYAQLYGLEYVNSVLINYGLSLDNIVQLKLHTLFTSMFLHAGAEHLILNMLALFFFCKVVEEELGWKKTLLIFMVSGLVGNVFFLAGGAVGLIPSNIPVIGASAAIFGIMGAAMLIEPFKMIFYPYLIPIPLVIVAVLYTIYNITDFVLVLAMAQESNISYISHIGGLIAGMAFGFKQEGKRRGLMVLSLIIFLMILIPMFWYLVTFIESTNYLNLMTQLIS